MHGFKLVILSFFPKDVSMCIEI